MGSDEYVLVGPADVELVGRGQDRVYVVTGVRRWSTNGRREPAIVPSRTMRIRPIVRRSSGPRWWLEVDGVSHSRHPTLRSARYEASRVEWPVG